MKKYTAPKQIRTYRNVWGGTDYYSGTKKIGSSHPNVWGGTTNYDAAGKKTGTSYKGIGCDIIVHLLPVIRTVLHLLCMQKRQEKVKQEPWHIESRLLYL